MLHAKVTITKNSRVKDRYYLLSFVSLRIAQTANPGQFLEVMVSATVDPLLRRPFGIHRVDRPTGRVDILYEVVGKGSGLLSKKKPGESLDLIGPLGNGYSLRNTRYAILIAGGMGVAPLLFVAQKMKASKKIALIGAATKSHILCEKDFRKFGCEVEIATDDGSKGFKGYVTELLEGVLRNTQYTIHNTVTYACGPAPMLKEVSRIAACSHIPSQVSLEAHMACGIGACLGCVVKTTKGFQRVCKEGPVFAGEEIRYE